MRIVIIGNGIAGNTAALRVRELNPRAEVIILSEEPFPLYSACVLTDYLGHEIDRERVFVKRLADYSKRGIKVLFGQKATALDIWEREVLLETENVAYDRLIIATGSEPILPPIGGVDNRGIFIFKSITDADEVSQHDGKRAVVVGSGPIGIQVAIALKRRGYRVTLIELLDHILPHTFDQYPASLLQNVLEEQGIKVLTDERVVRFLGSGSVEAVVTNKRRIKSDLVVLAVGARPRVSLAQQAGIEIGRLGGIKIDDHMLTSAANIYACGDCAQVKDRITGEDSLSLLWHNAWQQGERAGSNAAGIPRVYPGSLDIRVFNIFNTPAVSIGKNLVGLEQDSVEVIERHLKGGYYRLLVSWGRLAGVQSIGWIRDMGILLNTMQRKDELKGLEGMQSRLVPATVGWRCKLIGPLRGPFFP